MFIGLHASAFEETTLNDRIRFEVRTIFEFESWRQHGRCSKLRPETKHGLVLELDVQLAEAMSDGELAWQMRRACGA